MSKLLTARVGLTIQVRLPLSIAEQLDAARGPNPTSEWVRQAIIERLDRNSEEEPRAAA
jgi:hypothetical protein